MGVEHAWHQTLSPSATTDLFIRSVFREAVLTSSFFGQTRRCPCSRKLCLMASSPSQTLVNLFSSGHSWRGTMAPFCSSASSAMTLDPTWGILRLKAEPAFRRSCIFMAVHGTCNHAQRSKTYVGIKRSKRLVSTTG